MQSFYSSVDTCGMAGLFYMSLRRLSRRFPVLAPKAAVVCDEMLASAAGLDVLRRGGNAADATLAMAACMQVLQPYTMGLGGDCFALHYEPQTKKVRCVDGCGRSPAALSLELVKNSKDQRDCSSVEHVSGLQATVPGAAKAWFHIARHFGSGKMTMSELFAPAVHYAQHGFPMDHVKQSVWQLRHKAMLEIPGGRYFLDEHSCVPALGQTIKNQPLAALLKKFTREGPQAVYKGIVAENIADAVRRAGGVLSTQDLADHLASVEPLDVEPASATYRGNVKVHTTPLPTQGAVVLQALNIFESFQWRGLQETPGQFEHLMIEALRHAVADGLRYVADPATGGSLEKMVSKEHAQRCAEMLNPDRREETVYPEQAPTPGRSGTTFMAAVDDTGNVCALMGSNSEFFGCTVVEEQGICIQTRATGFNKVPGHPNCVGPRKKPYHSVMPVMLTDAKSGAWLGTLGSMGGIIQTSIITQLLLNMLELGLDPQESLARPRFLLGSPNRTHPDDPLLVEATYPKDVLQALKNRGHSIKDKYVDPRTHGAGHANIMAKASLWCAKEDDRNTVAGEHYADDGPTWCGVEPRINGSALGR
ncbi:glutathione hydrolase-like YwrD proenzyme [Dermacentor silvarum]|uniref:glutathione hydrolase-like YwrD proenzyme n=1 Tax=Dermacentor silvarum TaxID=543639 RepID=UPI002101BC85|nr:glutathione hydrolase-like YwrD proenzyme [Dermacentor silvarum]